MAKYRKRPVVVDAEQFTHPATAPRGVYVGENGECWVVTIHGQKTPVSPGDWIIAEPDGEHYYPCKPAIFEATYEKVPDPPALAKCVLRACATPDLCSWQQKCEASTMKLL